MTFVIWFVYITHFQCKYGTFIEIVSAHGSLINLSHWCVLVCRMYALFGYWDACYGNTSLGPQFSTAQFGKFRCLPPQGFLKILSLESKWTVKSNMIAESSHDIISYSPFYTNWNPETWDDAMHDWRKMGWKKIIEYSWYTSITSVNQVISLM